MDKNEVNELIDEITIENWNAVIELIPEIEAIENIGGLISFENLSDNVAI